MKKNTGINNPFYGHHHTKEANDKNREYHLGKVYSEKRNKKISDTLKNRFKNIPHHMIGKHLPDDWKLNISKSNSGTNNGFYGKRHKSKSKKGMSEKHKLLTGEKAPQWQGGLSYQVYGLEFNNQLKNRIKERDNYKCMHPNCNFILVYLDVHHIDYDKKNCSENNLICLCRKHHTITNTINKRKFFTLYYQDILEWRDFYNDVISEI